MDEIEFDRQLSKMRVIVTASGWASFILLLGFPLAVILLSLSLSSEFIIGLFDSWIGVMQIMGLLCLAVFFWATSRVKMLNEIENEVRESGN